MEINLLIDQSLSEEDKEVEVLKAQTQKKYKETPKYMRWVELFLDPKNKETFGNQTQSAILAYNLDPIKQYGVACTIGHDNLRKHKELAKQYYAKRDITAGKYLEVLWNKAVVSKDLELLRWIDNVFGGILPVQLPEVKADQYTQNNQYNVEGNAVFNQLTDDQLRQFIAGKQEQLNQRTRIFDKTDSNPTGDSTPGVGETDQTGTPQVEQAAQQTEGGEPIQ